MHSVLVFSASKDTTTRDVQGKGLCLTAVRGAELVNKG